MIGGGGSGLRGSVPPARPASSAHVTDANPADRSTDTATLAHHIDTIDGGLDATVELLDAAIDLCRRLDPAALQLIDPATGTASDAATAAALAWITTELDDITTTVRAAHARTVAINARARLLRPRG